MNNTTTASYGEPNGRTSRVRLEPLKSATKSLGFTDDRVTMRLIREGKLKAIKISNRIMVTTASLDKFVGA
ncbi:hypothetical protein [Bifidobacterium callitrichos]|uniref:Helix-turn-helix domain-containing protein n=1 Tax=Bifidobacterium callitrichos DSM 23973 TaxID=1437609 RepID=A0A087A914_9BIFI|nr:hypothetical protein [Bifidobacterium callitrichos]KFI55264.1 hypothetical protein BCAL_1280 [Bifidobacterium callitrichos DSM 23973]